MKFFKAFIPITLLLLFISVKLTAQRKLVSGKVPYTIPYFKSDSAANFDDWFVQHKIVSSIKNSLYPLEIRFWYKPWFMTQPDEGEYLIIKGNKDSISADLYCLKTRLEPQLNKQGTVFRKHQKNLNSDILLTYYHISPSFNLDSLLKLLLVNGVTNHPDNIKLMDSLRHNNVKLVENSVTDCCTTFNYEMKVDNKFRNFMIYPLYYTNENAGIKELQRGHQLINAPFKFDYLIMSGHKINTD
jgi:hypothetical protein